MTSSSTVRCGTIFNWPFKPDGQPASVQIKEPEPVNILTAMTENESVVKNKNDTERKAIALAWLFHLVGDIHQPLHTAQLFTADYPNGDQGGNEICIRVTQTGQPMDLHRFWDGMITTSQNLTRLRNEATALRNHQEFQRTQLTELASTGFEAWVRKVTRLRQSLLTETVDGSEFQRVALWTALWS